MTTRFRHVAICGLADYQLSEEYVALIFRIKKQAQEREGRDGSLHTDCTGALVSTLLCM
jgi:hypothetical protein